MKHLINLKEFETNIETNYYELLGLHDVHNEIANEILELKLSGTYLGCKFKALSLELELVKNRLVVFYN